MNFVVDLDSTLLDLPVIEKACENLDWPNKLTMRDARDWCMTTLPETVRAEVYRLFSDPDFMCTLKPVPGAVEFVGTLARRHTVWIATCRDPVLHERTGWQVFDLFPPDVALIVLSEKETKLNVYRNIPAHVAIDDSPANVAAAIMAGVPKVYMYSDERTPYNHRMVGYGGRCVDMQALLHMAKEDSWTL